MSNIARRFLSVCLPQPCFACGVLGDDLLCGPCTEQLPGMPPYRCPICALPTVDGSVCGACQKHTPHFDTTIAAFAYAFPIEEMIRAIKYGHRLAPAKWLGHALQRAIPREQEFDVIVPLPLHSSRLKARGFNQAHELARCIAKARTKPLSTTLGVRISDTVPQASLPWDERRRNVKDAFLIRQNLSNKTVMVVDDVMTTGATLDAFAKALKAHGARKVINAVVARTLRD